MAPVARACTAFGAALVVLSLFTVWGLEPDRALNAFERVGGVRAGALLLLGLVALAGALWPGRHWGVRVSLAAAVVAALVSLLALPDTDAPARGALYALAAALIAIAGCVAELLPESVRERGAPIGERLRGWRIPVPRPGAQAGEWVALFHWAVRPFWRVLTFTPVLAALVWIAAAPLIPLAPGGGTDGSWITALHLARERGLDFGTQFLYTYGPLGYLTVPRAYDPTQLRVGWIYVAAVYYGLAIVLIVTLRRVLPVLVAALLAMVVLECFRIVSPDEQAQFAIVAIAFISATLALRSDAIRGARWWPALPAVAGLVAGVESLVKLNTGVTIALVLGVASFAGARRWARGPLAFAGGLVIGLVGGWVAAGQPLGALDDYLRGSWEIVSGYADYSYTESGGGWEYAAVAVIVPTLSWLAWTNTATWPLRLRALLLVGVAAVVFSAFKQGFVRHDAHSLAFFATSLVVALGLIWENTVRPSAMLAAALCGISFLAVAQPTLYDFHRPRGSYTALRETLRTLRSPEAIQAQALRETQTKQAIPEPALRLLGRHTVHFFPSETSVAWTQPQLNWKPLPVIQGFTSYTAHLDGRNADALRSAQAPERLLRTREYNPFEDPETVMEVACRYDEQFAQGDWQVLTRSTNRCGAPRLVARITTATEEPLTPPAVGPRQLLYFRVRRWEKPLLERVQGFLWKPYARQVWFDGAFAGRLAPSLGTARNLLAVDPASDYSDGFRLGLTPRSLTFRMLTHGVTAPVRPIARPIVVEFYAAPLSRPARAAP